MRTLLARVWRSASSRNSILLFDTAATAMTSVLLVVGAARSLSPGELATFSLAQLCLVTMVGIIRTSFYGPAMAAQRTTGQARVPMKWVLALSAGGAVTLAGISAPFIAPSGQSLKWILLLLVSGILILGQDGLRAVLMSRSLSVGALISDLLALALVVGGFITGLAPKTSAGIIVFWMLALSIASAAALVYLWRRRSVGAHLPEQSMAKVWMIAKWAAVDATLSAFATLLPMFVVTLYVGSAAAGTYRTLQTAMGPLNILHTTVVTVFGLDSWQTATMAGLAALRRQVNRLTIALFSTSLAYIAVAIPAMVGITHISHASLTRIAVIVGVAAALGAGNTGYNAASLALGYQRFGAIIRSVVVIASILVSVPWVVDHVVPWHDPIGASMIISSTVTFGGWLTSYLVATHREHLALAMPRRLSIEDGVPIQSVVSPRRASGGEE